MPLRWIQRHLLPFVALVAAAASVSLAASSQPQSNEGWRYGRIEGFEVLSQLGDATTRRQVRDIAAVRRMIDHATGFDARYSQPCLLIFHRDKARYLSFLPASDTELAARTQSPTAVSARKFLRGTEQTALVHFGDIYQNPYAGGAAIVHNIFQQIAPRPPVWFRVGVGNLIRLTDPEITWNPRGYYTRTLQLLPPMHELLAMPLPASHALTISPDPDAPDSALGAMHHAAALFVHYGLYGEGGRHREKMIAFVRRAAEGPVDEAAFVACFGMDHAAMHMALREYMRSPGFGEVDLIAERKKQLAGLPTLELRAASLAEVARIEGEARIMAGYGGDAHRQFTQAHQAGERDPQLLASLGIAECGVRATDRARPLLEAAAAAGVPRPMLYLQLARLRYSEMKASAVAGTRVPRAEAAPVLAVLEKARALQPPAAEVYQCFVVLFADLADPLTTAELAIIDEAARLFPRDAELIFAGAKAKRDHGDAAGAAELIERGLAATNNTGVRARFERLRGTLTARLDPP